MFSGSPRTYNWKSAQSPVTQSESALRRRAHVAVADASSSPHSPDSRAASERSLRRGLRLVGGGGGVAGPHGLKRFPKPLDPRTAPLVEDGRPAAPLYARFQEAYVSAPV